METIAGLGVFGVLFVFVLSVLWIALPFAIFGIKPRLDKLHTEQRSGNELLRQLIGELQAARGYQPADSRAAPIPSVSPSEAPAPPPEAASPPAAAPAKPFDERAEKIARARALAAKVRPASPGENRME